MNKNFISFPQNLLVRTITALILFSLVILTLFKTPGWFFAGLVGGVWLLMVITELPRLIKSSLPFLAAALFWLGVPLGCLILLQNYGWQYLALFAIVMTAAHDTGAYLVGNICGKTKIWPSISPGKTWEGFFGGLVSCGITLMVWKVCRATNLSLLEGIRLACIVSYLATVGDLAESALKRHAHVKDSGILLPGHGGIFDRVDGLLPILFFVYISRYYLSSIL